MPFRHQCIKNGSIIHEEEAINKTFGLMLTLGAVVLVGCTAKANEISARI
jgi:hypothetical protein